MGILDSIKHYGTQYGLNAIVPGLGSVGSLGQAKDIYNGLKGSMDSPDQDLENQRKRLLMDQARASGNFAGYNEGQAMGLGRESLDVRNTLRRQAMGQDSLSQEQLRQGLGQQQAAQMSMAASANPNNAAMAARTAMNNMARNGYGMSGQAALAGIHERLGANQALGNMLTQQQGQALQAAINSRGNAMRGYGSQDFGALEKSDAEKWMPVIEKGAEVGKMFSDRRLKDDIEDADDEAVGAARKLKAYAYKYKNEQHGKGRQLGIMAQDLERAGLGHAVTDTPEGKQVDGAKLAGAVAAMTAALAKKVAKLERK